MLAPPPALSGRTGEVKDSSKVRGAALESPAVVGVSKYWVEERPPGEGEEGRGAT
jgi:hypothetical protein